MKHEVDRMIAAISKGQQITIPSEMRNALGINSGSKVEIELVGKKIIIKPVGDDLETLFEEAKKRKPKHKLSAKEMDEFNERMFR